MYSLLQLLLFSIALSTILFFLTWLFSKKQNTDFYSLSPFECGFSAQSEGKLPFSLQFFSLTLIFLIFDIEIIILFPYLVLNQSSMSLWGTVTFLVFLAFLSLGLFVEWNKMGLMWSKFI